MFKIQCQAKNKVVCVRTPCNSMAEDATSGFFDLTLRLRRSVSLRMTVVSRLAVLVYSFGVAALPVVLNAARMASEQQSQQAQPIPQGPSQTPPVTQSIPQTEPAA